MDRKLFEAARLGDVGELQSMIQADPLLLERVALVPFAETPLHIASLGGNTDFVKEILRLKPSFTWDLNKDGLSPLHIASALGDIETARVLLGSAGKNLCLLRDNDGRTPLHYAAMKGKVAVIKELVSKCTDTIKEVTVEGDTALHLAVKNKQFESLEALVILLGHNRSEVLAAKNKDGFTIFQFAKATYQLQVLELLEGKDTKALRPSDETLSRPQEEAAADEADRRTIQQRSETSDQPRTGSGWKKKFEHFAFRLFVEMFVPPVNFDKNTLLVVATLIATVTYQAAVTPPHFMLKENMKLHHKCLFSKSSPEDCRIRVSVSYMTWNTVGFLCSLVPLITSRAGRVSSLFILFAFCGLIGSYITLLDSMSSDSRPVARIIFSVTFVFLLCFSCGIVLPKLCKRFRQYT